MTFRRRRLIALGAIAAVIASGTTLPAHADPERSTAPAPSLPPLSEPDPRAFAAAAAQLPASLLEALERDVGMTGPEYLAREATGDAAAAFLEALGQIGDVRGAELRESGLVVYVGDERSARAAREAGASAIVGEAPEFELGGRRFSEAATLRGGEVTVYTDGSGSIPNSRCTSGFVGTSASSATQVITAGHCYGSAGARIQYNFVSGPWDYTGAAPVVGSATTLGAPLPGSYLEGDGYDHGLISVNDSAGWAPVPQITTWGYSGASNTQQPLTIRDARAPLVGETVCKSGATTGWTCGPILAVDAEVIVGTDQSGYVLNGTIARICVRGGDSGGPAVIGSTAIGVNSGTTAADGAFGRCVSDDLGVFAPLYSNVEPSDANYQGRSADSLYPDGDWEVSVAVATPLFAPTTGGVTRFTGATLTGSVPNGSSRHSVSLTVNGQPASATVSPSGAWSIDAAATIAPGRNTYQVQAQWGARSRSTSVSGSWLNAGLTRYTGADRYAAAAAISAGQFAPGVDVAFIATGDNFPDALAAGPIAARMNAPLLLTPRSNTLPQSVAAELDRLDPQRIIIIGGTASVPLALEAAAASYALDPTNPTDRINGADRYAVSRALLDLGDFTAPSRVWVVTGAGFADALSVSAAAASESTPVVLVPGRNEALDAATLDAISSLQPGSIAIGGGPNSVSEGIRSQLAQIAPTTRFGGADRFAASVAINNAVHATASTAYLANGLNYPDALAGGVVAGLQRAPLFIGLPACVPPTVVNRMLELSISDLRVLGGPNSVSASAANLQRC